MVSLDKTLILHLVSKYIYIYVFCIFNIYVHIWENIWHLHENVHFCYILKYMFHICVLYI